MYAYTGDDELCCARCAASEAVSTCGVCGGPLGLIYEWRLDGLRRCARCAWPSLFGGSSNEASNRAPNE